MEQGEIEKKEKEIIPCITHMHKKKKKALFSTFLTAIKHVIKWELFQNKLDAPFSSFPLLKLIQICEPKVHEEYIHIYPRKACGPQFFCRFFEVHFLQRKKAYNKLYSVSDYNQI